MEKSKRGSEVESPWRSLAADDEKNEAAWSLVRAHAELASARRAVARCSIVRSWRV